jgi:hypothetical protein
MTVSDVEPSAQNRMILEMPITVLILSNKPKVCYNLQERLFSHRIEQDKSSPFLHILSASKCRIFFPVIRSFKKNYPSRRSWIRLHISLLFFLNYWFLAHNLIPNLENHITWAVRCYFSICA